MPTTTQITVFVCGPTLNGEVLHGLDVRGGAVVWENGAEPAPQPAETIRAVHHLPGDARLVLLMTDVALYLITADDLPSQPFSIVRDGPEGAVHEHPDEAWDALGGGEHQHSCGTINRPYLFTGILASVLRFAAPLLDHCCTALPG
ncbi:MAG: hypothetical protein OHK0022_07100 [Roseiflexaceae bacterium]